jgi:uncharacterized OsmC-like protein
MDNVMAKGEYSGNLRTQLTHLKSGNTVTTDAPLDNNGKGEAFSPTDLVSAALSSCMMTIMGILAEREKIELAGLQSKVEKIMSAAPRKIAEIKIHFHHPNLIATDVQKQKLKQAAVTCPVALSLSSELKQTISFDF